jgi:hypothetical protein
MEIYSEDTIGGVMISVLVSSAVCRRFEPLLDQTKDEKLSFVAYLLSTQH